nr:PREDICTED: uncharacterized protein LOC107399130 [Tribolium castaneum]|eukprot:XP_015840319.1 PREDICTED: uncharacterized protein LOC107399130 [Tribolium castaneum]
MGLRDFEEKAINYCARDSRTMTCKTLNEIERISYYYENEESALKDVLEDRIKHPRSTRALDFIASSFEWCCGFATTQKLEKISMNDQELAERVPKIQQGLKETLMSIGKESRKFEEFQNKEGGVFVKIEERIRIIEKFAAVAHNRVTLQLNETEKTMLSEVYNSYMNLKRIIINLRTTRENSVVNDCRHHFIPQMLLPSTILKEDLRRLEEQIRKENQELAIPVSDVWINYTLPICDCTVVGGNITLQIRTPIRGQGRHWSLYELVSVPFGWNNNTCRIRHESAYVAVSGAKNAAIRTISGVGLHHCKPYENRLCFWHVLMRTQCTVRRVSED